MDGPWRVVVEGVGQTYNVFSPSGGEQCEGPTLHHLPTVAIDARTLGLLHLMLADRA